MTYALLSPSVFLGFSENNRGSRGGVPSPFLRHPRLSLASSLLRPLPRRYPAAPGRLPTAKLHLCRLLRGSGGGLGCQWQFCRGPSGIPPHTKAPRLSDPSARTASATLCPEAALQSRGLRLQQHLTPHPKTALPLSLAQCENVLRFFDF